ncbi:hypothetical protein SAMN04487974_101359 [Pelagibacterium luteolum]|uniref:Uncharacterized protein n=1 Tax=Pelagibacterium luteolum TaxID=440168 RepID=A0A1G7S9U0_9HYPH|nr:hypothetical protein SAMN04487974_101359 [Pelagibacterium luteolum]
MFPRDGHDDHTTGPREAGSMTREQRYCFYCDSLLLAARTPGDPLSPTRDQYHFAMGLAPHAVVFPALLACSQHGLGVRWLQPGQGKLDALAVAGPIADRTSAATVSCPFARAWLSRPQTSGGSPMLAPRLAKSWARIYVMRWLRWRAERAALRYLDLSRRAERIYDREATFFGLGQEGRQTWRVPACRSMALERLRLGR